MGVLRKLDMVKLKLTNLLKSDPDAECNEWGFVFWRQIRPLTLKILYAYYKIVEEDLRQFPMVDMRHTQFAKWTASSR